ncbi:glycosyltransferase family 2 protein [Streptomyces sp. S1D4-20]|uniref:glycosyltransferase family 2 protein n=1 Tax=Streptomyces sp. S1D4-20 TaxID=2594462 RepID=UPI001F0719FF|nr:glycosyltransferase family 2 protein [Streptomyces sp. S1D4-20]
MPRTAPQISVITPTRLLPNRLPYLEQLHESLTAQTVEWELVLALDGAEPDLVPNPLTRDRRVKVLRLPKVGAAGARNLALNLAEGDWIQYADDDDVFPSDAFAVRHSYALASNLGWVAGQLADLSPDGTTRVWQCPTPPGVHTAGAVWTYWPTPQDTIPLCQTQMIARRELVQAACGHGGLPQGEDLVYVCALTALSAGALLPVVTYLYRQHEEQMTRSRDHDRLEGAVREFAWHSGRQLRARLENHPTPHIAAAGSAA